MALKIYNTMTGRKEDFLPRKGNKVGMYVCGPTVYDNCHIGHARANISFDIVYRYLKSKGYEVKYVRNITDVDDKIINRANSEKRDYREIAQRYIDSFHEDMASLGLLDPDTEPRASENVDGMIEMIKGLIKNGFAYQSGGDVYFSVGKFKEYTKLSKRNLDEMEAGARVEASDKKGNPYDFALWKTAKEDEPSWPSPWGPGRPGWHIECSVMSSKCLGDSLDIHGGGRDLIFPHHENEIAQSESSGIKPFFTYWMHNGFVNINKEKMSKSLGNFVTVKKLREVCSIDAFKYFVLGTHYRSPIDFSDDLLQDCEKAVERVYKLFSEAGEIQNDGQKAKAKYDGFKDLFSNAMDDDFNTAKALGIFFDYVNKGFVLMERIKGGAKAAGRNKLIEDLAGIIAGLSWAGSLLGLFEHMNNPQDYFHRAKTGSQGDEKGVQIEALIALRQECRKNKEWAKADEIRKRLIDEYGVELEDKKEGTRWKFVK